MVFYRLLLLLITGTHAIAQVPKPTAEAHLDRTGAPMGKRYFGMHFDFHAVKSDSLMGRGLSQSRFDSLLAVVKPDFIQVDCKGHPGVASYPSKVANATTGGSFVNDPLAFYRAVTRKHGVDLYVHYSGVEDHAALTRHPDWGVVKANDERDASNTSVHSAYVDSLLIPQLNELADYGIDGVWVDGDCWATKLDYSPTALARFKAKTGIQSVPRSDKDPNYQAFRDFARQSFMEYVGHYVDEAHRHNPTFRVASNWAYSSMMPEPITTNVDYLSGDLTPNNSVNKAALEARILAAQGRLYKKPWDLMSWSFWYGFTNPPVMGDQKTAIHLMQDAAEVIAVGGGYQNYFLQSRDASISLGELPIMVDIGKFMRARQPFCAGSSPIPQVAVLYSSATVRKYNKSLFGGGESYRIQGVVTALLDAQIPVEILSEHHLEGRMSQYPLIVVSQQDSLAPAFRQALLDYARQGGNLLLIGAETTRIFAPELSVTPAGNATASTKWVRFNGTTVALNSLFQPVLVKTGQPFGQMEGSAYGEPLTTTAATTVAFGKGKLVGIYADVSLEYERHQSSKLRDFIAALTRPLLPNPVVTVTGSHLVHVVANRLGNQMAINLINTGGHHANPQVFTYDEVSPLMNLIVRIRVPKKPQRIVQQPENKLLPVAYTNGVATVTVPKLDLHSILLVR